MTKLEELILPWAIEYLGAELEQTENLVVNIQFNGAIQVTLVQQLNETQSANIPVVLIPAENAIHFMEALNAI